MDCVNGGLFSSCMTSSTAVGGRHKARKPRTNQNSGPDSRSPKWANAIDFDPSTPERKKQIDVQSDLLKGLFSMIDQNNNGSLQIDELRAVMGNADTFISVVDTNHDASISEEEFYAWSREYIVCHLPDENVDRMNKLIKIALIGKRGKNVPKMDASAIFDSLDIDGDGKLSLEELAKVLGTDAKEFLDCLDTVHKDGSVERSEFMRWTDADQGEFKNLDAQLEKIYQEVAAGTLHLFSKYADKVAQSRNKPPVVNLK